MNCPKPSCFKQQLLPVTGQKGVYVCWRCKDEYIINDAGTPEKKDPMVKKKNKYSNTKTKIDGILFDSQLEAEYYCRLKLMLSSGDISGFSRHPRFLLTPESPTEKKSEYIADFSVFYTDGTYEVIDTKGMRTSTYIQKIKTFKTLFPGIIFREVSKGDM